MLAGQQMENPNWRSSGFFLTPEILVGGLQRLEKTGSLRQSVKFSCSQSGRWGDSFWTASDCSDCSDWSVKVKKVWSLSEDCCWHVYYQIDPTRPLESVWTWKEWVVPTWAKYLLHSWYSLLLVTNTLYMSPKTLLDNIARCHVWPKNCLKEQDFQTKPFLTDRVSLPGSDWQFSENKRPPVSPGTASSCLPVSVFLAPQLSFI